MNPRFATLLVLGLLPATAASQPVPTCPASEMRITGGAVVSSTSASYDSSVFYTEMAGYRTAYDHPAGTVEVHHCCGLGRTSVRARDRYDLVDVPAGTTVHLVAELGVEGEILSLGCSASGCWGTLGFGLTAGTASSESYLTRNLFAPGREAVRGGVALPLTMVAGQPVVIERLLWAQKAAGGSHGAVGIGRLRFTGLPDGARVVSCQGYAAQAVPALRPSWGTLRVRYR